MATSAPWTRDPGIQHPGGLHQGLYRARRAGAEITLDGMTYTTQEAAMSENRPAWYADHMVAEHAGTDLPA